MAGLIKEKGKLPLAERQAVKVTAKIVGICALASCSTSLLKALFYGYYLLEVAASILNETTSFVKVVS